MKTKRKPGSLNTFSAKSIITVLLLLCFSQIYADFDVPEKMDWWYEARFGMFIHFGSYSYQGEGEWVMASGWSKEDYQTQITANFNPVNFDAEEIAGYAASAGMRYLVITAKHHEGFAMWDSSVSSFTDTTGTKLYNLNNYINFERDLLQELKTACEAVGVKFCLYYSILDWNHPSQTGYNFTTMESMDAREAYISDMKLHLDELLDRYDPPVLWFDGDWTYNTGDPTLSSWWTLNDGLDLYSYLTDKKPELIINERVFRGSGIGDFECPEQTVPSNPESRQWETCQTMNGTWGYTSWAETNYRTVTSLVQELITVVSRDGNYLLNIGPMGDGSMTSGSKDALSGIGSWMDVYSDSIYGTTGTPFMDEYNFNEPDWGRYTKKAGKLFAHVFTWPSSGTISISGITNTINDVYLLNDPDTSLGWSVNGENFNISIPSDPPDDSASVIVLECAGIPVAGTPGTSTGTTGDVDNSGSIDIIDALLTAQYYVGLDPAGFDSTYADADCDGIITIVDALLISQYYVGLISEFC